MFGKQLANVIEWKEFRDDMIFWKWSNDEIKKGSKVIIRPGQDAIFFKNGKIEGIFKDSGEYDVQSQIIPFLSTLKSFKFGFNTPMRAEVLFVNTKEFTIKWGTRNVINIPSADGIIPIRANGTLNFKAEDYVNIIENVAGIRASYVVDDLKIRITSVLDGLLMKRISQSGGLFNIQANSDIISRGIMNDLDMNVCNDGFKITGFHIMSVSYPDSVQEMAEKNAAYNMVADVGKFQQMAMAENLSKQTTASPAADMAQMMMGMQMANQMNNNNNNVKGSSEGSIPNFCPSCGQKTNGMRFCGSCGYKLG